MIDHTFSICAYKKSEFLEECIISLKNQTVKSNIIMCTSTRNSYIEDLARKYEIPLFVREGKSNIKDDWNFAYNSANTTWVTLAHQDDKYDEHYEEEFQNCIKENADSIAFLTDYKPIKNGIVGNRDINSKIRRFLRSPLKIRLFSNTSFWKRNILSLGNTICCPSVSYNKNILGDSFFTSSLSFNIDWDTFLKFSRIKGRLAYVDKPLTFYRIHNSSTSKEFILNNNRVSEDFIMFRKFWPAFLTKFLMIFYKKAYKTYD